MSTDSNDEKENHGGESQPDNTQNEQNDNTYLPSFNSGIFGSYYTTPQNNYSPSLNTGVFGSYLYTPPTDIYRVVDEDDQLQEDVDEVKEEDSEQERKMEAIRREKERLEKERIEKLKREEENKKFSNNPNLEETKEDEPVPHYELPPATSLAPEYKELYQQYTKIKYDDTKPIQPLDNNLKPMFDNFKQIARQTGKTFTKVETNVDYNKTGICNTIGLDIDVKTFNKDKFIRQYCNLHGLHPSQVNIIAVKAGSCVIEVYISNNGQHEIDLSKLTERLDDPEVQDKLKEMKAFCVMFNKPKKHPNDSTPGTFAATFQERRAYFNSSYDRIYGPGNIMWEGDLQDGKDRWKPYYCPSGWYKRAVTYKLFSSMDFDKKFKGWPIAYHGTKFEYGMSMLLSGLLPSGSGSDWGPGVYVTPSIIYAAHPRYAEPKLIPPEAKEGLKKFGDGDYIQFAFQLRIDPNSPNTQWDMPETFKVGDKKIDPNYKNTEVEWIINSSPFQDPTRDDCNIYIVGLMIRVTKGHPRNLPESKWYQ